jgi:hypothetical protein
MAAVSMFGFPLVLSPAAEWGIFLGHDFERWPSRLVATAASTGLIPRELACPPQGQLIKQDAAKNGLR